MLEHQNKQTLRHFYVYNSIVIRWSTPLRLKKKYCTKKYVTYKYRDTHTNVKLGIWQLVGGKSGLTLTNDISL